MARLPLVDEQPDDPGLRLVFERARHAQGRVSNLYRTLAGAPAMLEAWIGMAWPLRNQARTPRALRELVIMRVAQVTGARYEWAHHWHLAVSSGVGETKLRALREWRASDAFDAPERAALAYTDEVVEKLSVADSVYGELARHFDGPAVIELTLTASFYCHVSRTLRALEIDLEPGFEAPMDAM